MLNFASCLANVPNFSALGLINLNAAGALSINLSAQGNAQVGIDPNDYKSLYAAAQNGVRVLEFGPDILTWPSGISAGGTFVSPVLPSMDYAKQFVAATSTQSGVLSLIRFADKGGTIVIDTTTALMTANIQASVSLADSKYSQAVQISVSNTSGSPATLSKFLASVAL